MSQWQGITCSAGGSGDVGLVHGLGRFSGGGHGNRLQYSCLEDLNDRGAWRATVHRVQRVGNDWGDLKWRGTKKPIDNIERGE